MGWTKVEPTTGFTWEGAAPGLSISGTILSFTERTFTERDGTQKGRKYVALSTKDGEVTVPCPTMLANTLNQLEVGDTVAIRYQGERAGMTGMKYKDFDVRVWEEEARAPLDPPQPEEPDFYPDPLDERW